MTVRHAWRALLAAALMTVAVPAAGASAQDDARAFDVAVSGRGPAIIAIPGLLSTGEVWSSTVERYQGRYTLHVLTLAGFGGPTPIGAPLLSRVRDQVIAYIREQKLTKPIVIGHSLGGFLAFWIASTAPDLVGGVVAVDGVPFLPALANPAATIDGVRAQADRMRALYASLSREQLVAQTRLALERMISAPGDVERALDWTARSDAATAGVAIAELMSHDLRGDIATITVPTLLIGALGAVPEALRPAVTTAYAAQVANLRGARVIMADTARHFIMLDDPAFFFAALDAFLAK